MRTVYGDGIDLHQPGFTHRWVADLIYQGDVRIPNLPISNMKMGEDGTAQVQTSGSCTVVWTSALADSLTPETVSDPLAPFGAQLAVSAMVEAGRYAQTIPYGLFWLSDVPQASDDRMWWRAGGTQPERLITVGSTVDLTLSGLLYALSGESWDVPSTPSQLASTWAEVAAVTGFQVTRTLPDVPITRTVQYQDGKLDSLYTLMATMLDAIPHVLADGTLAARPVTDLTPVDSIDYQTGLVSVGASMSPDGVYNRVVTRSNDAESQSVLAVAEVTSGPLRAHNPDGTRSPFGARTYYQSSELVTTAAQAQAWCNSTLAQVSHMQSHVIPVVETFNPARERGDVIEVDDGTGPRLVRVVTIDRSDPATQNLTVETILNG